MASAFTSLRNVLVPMRDGVALAVDVLHPAGEGRHPALLNFGPYHKDGRGGRTAVDAVHRHFVARGYATVTADLRGLGNSGGTSPGAFAPGEGQDGHDLVAWIAAQPWCDGNVGMWGVSYPGITALATAATRPPQLKAIVPIHATSDLHRGAVALGGTRSGFWMRADWGQRMLAYNLMPPQFQDADGRWARIWAEHLEGNAPWLEAFVAHPRFDDFWRARVADMAAINCPCLSICGWRDLYADCTPRDFAAIAAPKRLVMGPWKHEFPDTAKQAPAAGLAEMERWFDRWLRGIANGIEHEPPVALHVQGRAGSWRAERQWPPARVAPQDLFLAADGSLGAAGGTGASAHRYDPTIGMQSLSWDPWTTALDPHLPQDHAADDARALCFTGAPLAAPLELIGVPVAELEIAASALPLDLVVKLSVVDANGRSVLITSGWTDLTTQAVAGAPARVVVPLRATAYRLEPGQRLRVALACADFPRVWPTPVPATLRVFHGASRITLPVCPLPLEAPAPDWGRLQPEALAAAADLGGSQSWEIARELMTDTARLAAARSERVRLDGASELSIDHAYGAAVSAARPDLARMHATTTVRLSSATGVTRLVARSVTTGQHCAATVEIDLDGQPFWSRSWRFDAAEGGGGTLP
jgi:putative CocE/NonD family hydrolase